MGYVRNYRQSLAQRADLAGEANLERMPMVLGMYSITSTASMVVLPIPAVPITTLKVRPDAKIVSVSKL
jgi:hypothetical protein